VFDEVKLDPPTGLELPNNGFDCKDSGYIDPIADGSNIEIKVNSKSKRLQLLEPFKPIGNNIKDAQLLIKTFGKCTTDHISMAGPWLRYRGHLDNISNNCLIGAINAFSGKTNAVISQIDGTTDEVPNIARQYKAAGITSIIVGDHNYGEGSSREHAAMEPRHLGVIAVIVKSFARIHETNLKKQGMLGLTFENENDYDLVEEDDVKNILDLDEFKPSKKITIQIVHSDGKNDLIFANHFSHQNERFE
jgi:aconitate hydratase